MKKLAFYLLSLYAFDSQAYVSLGDGNNCDYDFDNYTIQQVIDIEGATSVVHITNEKEYFENIELSESNSLKGGFANCLDANSGTVTGKTTINGSNYKPVITVSGNTDYIFVYINDLKLKNGKGLGSSFGGGISVNDSNDSGIDLYVTDTSISNNVGAYGGGIYLNGHNQRVTLRLNNSDLINNDATSNGGGIYCYGSSVIMKGDSDLMLNSAYSTDPDYGHGGGIYANQGCTVNFITNFKGQIYGNSSSNHGGGVYIGDNSKVKTIGSPATTGVVFKGNFSDSDANFTGNGGAVYLKGNNSLLDLTGGIFEGNNAYYGGAISATEGAQVNLGKKNNKCWNQNKCNVFENNTASKTAGRGGAIHLNASSAEIAHMVAYENRADMATVIYAENSSEAVILASMIYRNGNGGLDDWEDIYTYKTYNSNLSMVNVTSANNASQSAIISQTNSGHILLNSIFYEPLQNLLADFVNTTSIKNCLLMNDNNGMGTVSNSIIGSPSFVDMLNDDYHLTKYSNAIDMCGFTPLALSVDIDSNNNGWNDPNVLDMTGMYDAGADESYAGDVIFQSGF